MHGVLLDEGFLKLAIFLGRLHDKIFFEPDFFWKFSVSVNHVIIFNVEFGNRWLKVFIVAKQGLFGLFLFASSLLNKFQLRAAFSLLLLQVLDYCFDTSNVWMKSLLNGRKLVLVGWIRVKNYQGFGRFWQFRVWVSGWGPHTFGPCFWCQGPFWRVRFEHLSKRLSYHFSRLRFWFRCCIDFGDWTWERWWQSPK